MTLAACLRYAEKRRPARRYTPRGPSIPLQHLLAVIEEEPCSTTREIAEALGARHATVLERLRRLRAEGVVNSRGSGALAWFLPRPAAASAGSRASSNAPSGGMAVTVGGAGGDSRSAG